ncbi:MAG: hypothetical protein D6689_04605 [Deltaproteobacteria bacterium]|nr:MAG: hypothetical protein D6689_04605 [Deltaproteobacteria bacterium]
MTLTTRFSLPLSLSLLLFACAPASEEDVGAARGLAPSGKADGAGSCDLGTCGGQAAGGCWCDDLCAGYGDCCANAGDVCGVDECDANANTGCADGETCVAGEPNLCHAPASCGPQAATGVGLCERFFGYAWNGVDCVGVSGCSCNGDDCDALYTSPDACRTAHAACYPGEGCPDWTSPEVKYVSFDPATCATVRFQCAEGKRPFSNECGCGCEPEAPAMCGGIANIQCTGANDYCDVSGHCGATDQSGVCRERPQFCPEVYQPVCGCDGTTYGNACKAAAAGASVASEGPCKPAPNSCADHCGGSSEDGSCWCDAACSYYGDCCADKASTCG